MPGRDENPLAARGAEPPRDALRAFLNPAAVDHRPPLSAALVQHQLPQFGRVPGTEKQSAAAVRQAIGRPVNPGRGGCADRIEKLYARELIEAHAGRDADDAAEQDHAADS
jgi:hypothetical protein